MKKIKTYKDKDNFFRDIELWRKGKLKPLGTCHICDKDVYSLQLYKVHYENGCFIKVHEECEVKEREKNKESENKVL